MGYNQNSRRPGLCQDKEAFWHDSLDCIQSKELHTKEYFFFQGSEMYIEDNKTKPEVDTYLLIEFMTKNVFDKEVGRC